MLKINLLVLFYFFCQTLTAQQETITPVIESRSRMSFNETLDFIKSSAESKAWKVLIVHDLQASLRKSGEEVLPVSVIEICKPAYSGPVLRQNSSRLLSVFMPCRVSVYEKGSGEVYVSRMNAAVLKSFDEDAFVKINEAGKEIESILAEVITE